MSASRKLNRLAVRLRDIEALLSGDPRRILGRLWNKAVGRAVGRVASRLYVRRRRR